MKYVLLVVCGLSPQVITETLYAFHQEGKWIESVHVITTRSGSDIINSLLLAPDTGHYYRYLKDFGLDPARINFTSDNVHIIADETGHRIDDITDEEDNELLLRKCLEITFSLTSDPERAVFFLVAGGRKTMSSCLTLAAQLYGRRQDRIYHVLVSPDFENSREFFYPPPEPTQIELKDGNGHPFFKSTEYARISLIPMPFVSIRDRLSDRLLRTPQDPASLMLSVVREERPVLTVSVPDRKLVYKKMELDLPPALMALYAFFGSYKKESCHAEKASCKSCDRCFLDMEGILAGQSKIREYYSLIVGDGPLLLRADKGILSLDVESFNSHKSKIKRQIEQGFGPHIAQQLEIASIGVRPDTRFGIRLDRKRMRLVL